MGVVYEALDRERNERVALKTLSSMHPDAVLSFKTEFRALQDLEHPNLVSLGEMFEDAGVWFFTMELLEGAPLLDYVRPGGVRDEARLRHAMGELARGVDALHAAGKIHRDIKPSNAIMTDRGRGVLVDFGLVTDADASAPADSHIVGTVAYMAPEQCVGGTVGPAADWYAVGVVLYEALTGRLPFSGKRLDVLSDKQRFEPAPPRAVDDSVPGDLDALCVALLRHDPVARPTGADVLRRLNIAGNAGASRTTLTSADSRPPFVGRVHELGILADAFDSAIAGRAVTVVVRGPSGVGKTSLVRHFTAQLGEGSIPPLVLDGRCFERESVPFKAIDGVVDAMSRHLVGLAETDADALVAPSAAWIGKVFPVFRRVEAVARARATDIVDPQEQRRRMFDAVREQLHALATHRPTVVLVDDFQWADADSVALLGDVLREPAAPPLLVVVTSRTAVPIAELAPGDVRDIELTNLPPDRARELAAALLTAHGNTESEEVAGELADEAGGHPLFIDELVRHRLVVGNAAPGVRLDDALWARVHRLDPAARRILEVLAVAAAPLPQRTAARVATLGASAFNRHVALLRVAQLVRTAGAGIDDAIETYHDRVRDAVLAHLSDTERTHWHARLAVALEASGDGDPETLAHHLLGAGDPIRAAGAFERAAAAAEAAWAFDRAARLYQRTLDLSGASGERRRALLARLGEALANAGRGRDAGDAFVAASAGASDADVLELRRRAAGQFLASGHVDRGLDALADVLASVDMSLPRGAAAALWPLVRGRIATRLRGLRFRERDATHVSARELTRIDVCWTAASLMGFVDAVRAGLFQTTHLRLAFRAGEPYRVARALAVEAPFAAAGGHNRRYVERVSTLATDLANRSGNPHAVALAVMTRGVVAFLRGEWKRAAEHIASGEHILREQCTGVTWELQSSLVFKVACRMFLGQVRVMRAEVPAFIHAALERGDVYGATNLRSGHANFAWLLGGEPAIARRHADAAIAAWSHEGYHSQHFMDMIAQASIDLYTGDADRAVARIDDAWTRASRAHLFRVQLFRMFGWDIRARANLAAGNATAAHRAIRKLRAEGIPAAQALAALHAATADGAPEGFAAAAALLDHADMALHAAVARWRAGDETAARRWLHDQGVAEPDRIAATLSPTPRGLRSTPPPH